MKVTFDALTLAPAAVPMVAVLLVLVVDVILPRSVRAPWIVTLLGLAGALGAAVGIGVVHGREATTLCARDGATTCWYVVDRPGLALQVLALLAALVVAVLALAERPAPDAPGRSRAAVRATMVLAATAGCVGVIAARDAASWLVLIELATLPSVALVALHGGRRAAHGALTLLVTALASFAVLALGVAMWFAATGSASLSGDHVLAAYRHADHRPLMVVAMMLIVAGVGFKLSLAPFHAWTPEAFAGSGTWVAAFLATTSKVGALGGMLVVLRAAAPLGNSTLMPLAIVSALSMTLGNVMALRQRGALRLMAWSTVAQAGWVVLPMTAVAPGAVRAAGAYLALYTIGTLAVFVVLAAFEDAGRRSRLTPRGREFELEDMRGLFRARPLFAGTLTLGLLALAGLPPSIIGVVAKIVALKPAVSGHLWWLVVIAAVNAVLGVAVYVRWVAIMFTAPASADEADAEGGENSWDLVDPTSSSLAAQTRPSRTYGVLAAAVSLLVMVLSLAPQYLLGAF